MEGKTSTGFEFRVEEERAYSYELIEAIKKMEENPIYMTDVGRILLGDEQLEKLKKHLRGDKEFTPVREMDKALEEIFNALPKNLQP